MTLPAPKLHPIDAEMLLFGSIHVEWDPIEGVSTYYIYRDFESIENVDGWVPYAIIEDEKNYYDDYNFQNGEIFYYAVTAISDNSKSALSNTERIKINIPPTLVVETRNIKEAAYYESQVHTQFDEKIWQIARLQLIFEKTFPNRELDYLKIKVKSIKRDLPEFNGLFVEPTESDIRQRAQIVYEQRPDRMNIDWRISEKNLIIKKIQDLLEYETITR